MRILRKFRSSMAVSIAIGIVCALLGYGFLTSTIGYFMVSYMFQERSAISTYHIADTAALMVNGDHIEEYLAGEQQEEYSLSEKRLDLYCEKIHVSLVYVIAVDTSDYGSFRSVFNSINNAVDNSTYTKWELGYERKTTNEEYRKKYRDLYEQKIPYATVYRVKPIDGSHPHITTLLPIKNSSGDVSALLCVQRPMRELRRVIRPYLVMIVIVTAVLATLISILVISYMRRHFFDPIRKVSREAVRFAKENVKGQPLGTISRFDEIENLTQSIETMETDMVNYIDNLTTATAEKERISAELSLASGIQKNSVPGVFPAFPDRNEFDIYASMTPAKEVGGDFYNFFLVDDDHLVFMIGDVSGKGVPAALFMMSSNIVLSDRAQMGGTPAEIVQFANVNICEHNELMMFLTIWVGILEISTGRVTAASAGHEFAAVSQDGAGFILWKTKNGLPIGAEKDSIYRNFEIQLKKGDKLFLYTDGVPEATDCNNNMFTTDRMLEALDACRDKSPEGILEGMKESVDIFAGGAPQFDDLTMLCIEYRGAAED